jgi:hypothetical protein
VTAPTSGSKLVASDPEFQRPSFAAYQVTTQSVTNTVATAITMTAEVLDTINGHSNSSLTSRYTPSVPGYYMCIGQVAWALSTAGDRNAQFRKNGATLDGAPYGSEPALNGAAFIFGGSYAMAVILCNGTTDYIELFGNQNSGGALNTAYSAGGTSSFMSIWWMHD